MMKFKKSFPADFFLYLHLEVLFAVSFQKSFVNKTDKSFLVFENTVKIRTQQI